MPYSFFVFLAGSNKIFTGFLLLASFQAERPTCIGKLKVASQWEEKVLELIAAAFGRAFEFFRKVVDVVIRFAQSNFGGTGHKDIFNTEEAATIKDAMVKIAGEKGDHRRPHRCGCSQGAARGGRCGRWQI